MARRNISSISPSWWSSASPWDTPKIPSHIDAQNRNKRAVKWGIEAQQILQTGLKPCSEVSWLKHLETVETHRTQS
jgi:hypothetical protein